MAFPSREMALAGLAVGAAVTLAAAEPVRRLVLFDFENPCGQFNPGAEFPGAVGRFSLERGAAHDGGFGGRLSFDLSRGAYVAWVADVPVPLAEGASELTVWVRPDAPGRTVHCKTRDQTGQEHVRFQGPLKPDEWQLVTFDLRQHSGHWGGANDGVIHWPIVAVQIGVEAKGSPRAGTLDLDTVAVTTTAPPEVQPGLRVRLESDRYGSLFLPRETVRLRLVATIFEERLEAVFQGDFAVHDWQDREVARGALGTLSAVGPGERQVPFEILPPGPGAFRVTVRLADARNPAETLGAVGWVGVLAGPNPAPCGWVGTGLHGGHGWARGDLRFLDILSAAGIGVVREEFGWGGIEKRRGEYAVSPEVERFVEALRERGIRLNLLLTYGNPIYENPLDPEAYARWAGWMAAHFRGRVHDFEIWNEPANFYFKAQYGGERFGNAPWIGKFVELTRAAGDAIRAAQPEATVIVGAEDVWPTLRQMLEEGLGPAGHAISIHPYCHGQPRPEREWFLADGGRELRRVSREFGGPERVVITEAGWTTYEGTMEYLEIAGGYPRSSLAQQAQYIVRMYVTARSCGADYAIQYDFMDDGPRREYTEHNFGLVHEDGSPKPSLVAVAVLARLVGEGRCLGDRSPDPGRLRTYVFEVGGQPVLVAYAVEGTAELDVPVGVPRVEIADLMGVRRPQECPGGRLRMTLTEAPVYVLGGDRAAASRFCRFEVDRDTIELPAGDTVRVPVRFSNRSGASLRPRVRCMAPAGVRATVDWGRGWRPPLVPDGADQPGEVAISLDPRMRQAARVVLAARTPSGRVERVLTVRPSPPLAARFGGVRPEGDSLAATLTVTNLTRRPLTATAAVTLASGGSAALPQAVCTLRPGESQVLPVRIQPGPSGTEALAATARLVTDGDWSVEVSQVLLPSVTGALAAASLTDGLLEEWDGATRLRLGHATQYDALPGRDAWEGPGDLSATVLLGWRPEGLCVAVETVDDVFCQTHRNDQIWQGDSVQIAVAPEPAGAGRFEIGLARTPDGDRWFLDSALARGAPESLPPVRFASRPASAGGGLTYEVVIPWEHLPGIAPRPGTRFRFSLLVNDDDGKGRRGWLHAFDGIGWSKDPAQYGVLELGAPGAAPEP